MKIKEKTGTNDLGCLIEIKKYNDKYFFIDDTRNIFVEVTKYNYKDIMENFE